MEKEIQKQVNFYAGYLKSCITMYPKESAVVGWTINAMRDAIRRANKLLFDAAFSGIAATDLASSIDDAKVHLSKMEMFAR